MVDLLGLSCSYQTYAWGKRGKESQVAKLMKNNESFQIREEENYAELWVGTHSKGPSTISYPPELKGTLLSVWLTDNQWALGNYVAQTFDGNLPFLFKVLSVSKALSIQAHPTKDHARVLHSADPGHYPDPNHKPEMVIAVTPFEGLCGFRLLVKIKEFVLNLPELQRVLGPLVVSELSDDLTTKTSDKLYSILKSTFAALMNQQDSLIKEELDKLQKRFEAKDTSGVPDEIVDLFLRLYSWYPGDVGVWACFFLNYFQLEEGQSLYLAPNEPHAYISGDVVECMALSDNVVRAGLTPKFKDKDTLCSMLTYSMRQPSDTLFTPCPHPVLKVATVYDPPTPEFTVVKICCEESLTLPSINGPSVLLVYSGSGTVNCGSLSTEFTTGSVYFVPAGRSPQIEISSNTILYQAYCQL